MLSIGGAGFQRLEASQDVSGRAAARFEATALASKAADLLGRLRGLAAFPPGQIDPLARDAGIARLEWRNTLLPYLEAIQVIAVERDDYYDDWKRPRPSASSAAIPRGRLRRS
jgi:hypothetical protein